MHSGTDFLCIAEAGTGASGEPAACHDPARPTIRLATDDDMRAITSQTLGQIFGLPWFYIPTDEADVMRAWGVALAANLSVNEQLYSGTLIAPQHAGQMASRGDLLYHGAEPAAAFIPSSALPLQQPPAVS
jgi:hypothetical protein